MPHIILKPDIGLQDTLSQMHEAAQFDVSDDDSLATGCMADNTSGRHGALPKVPKLFLSNNCIFNCAYCGCRSSLDKRRYAHTPQEMADIAIKTAKKTGTGIFITSAIYKSPDYTVELIVETLRILRRELGFWQYIHAKIMPGTDPHLIEEAGWLADRLSVNIEIPNSAGYPMIAPQKNRDNILSPIGEISHRILNHRHERGKTGRKFARSGQTTQVMVGTMQESDRTLLTLAEAMYRKYRLRRVYYSAFSPAQPHFYLPSQSTPKWRSWRLYQADRLVMLYGFAADDLVPEDAPDFPYDMDPKAAWAMRHLGLYPVEVNRADYTTLLRVPGIGVASAEKIIKARKQGMLTHAGLRELGIALKRARFFITCDGKYDGGKTLDGADRAAAVLRDRDAEQLSMNTGKKDFMP